MKAKLVKEELNQFTREGDPFDKLNIGDSYLRKMNTGVKEIQDIISEGYSRDSMNFSEVINITDDLRRVVDYTVMNHLKKKYGFQMQMGDHEWRVFFTPVKGDRLLVFSKSSTSRSFEMVLYDGPTTDSPQIAKTPASTSIKNLDAKIDGLIKLYQIL